MLRKSRTDPGVHPILGKPVYPEQRRIAQRSHLRAISSKFVPVRGALHELFLKERDDFVVGALGTLHGSGRWLEQRAYPTIRTLMLLLLGCHHHPARQTRAHGRGRLVSFISRDMHARTRNDLIFPLGPLAAIGGWRRVGHISTMIEGRSRLAPSGLPRASVLPVRSTCCGRCVDCMCEAVTLRRAEW